jgi:hypothetical protein
MASDSDDDEPMRKLRSMMDPFRSLRGLENLASGFRSLRAPEWNNSLASELANTGFGNLMASQLAGLHKAFASQLTSPELQASLTAQLTNAFRTDMAQRSVLSPMVSTLVSLHTGLAGRSGPTAMAEMVRAAQEMLPKNMVASIAAFDTMSTSLSSMLPTELCSMVNERLAGSVVPTILALGTLPGERATGILSLLTEQPLMGSFSWLSPSDDGDEDEPKVSVASWHYDKMPTIASTSEASAQRVTINIQCKVVCMLCSAPLLSADQHLSATSMHELVVTLAVVPICANCTEKTRKDPRYLLQQLEGLGRPKFRLVDGQGGGDGIPRGSLHLVEDDGNEEGET